MRLICTDCGDEETLPPFATGDTCNCGGRFVQQRSNRIVSAIERLRHAYADMMLGGPGRSDVASALRILGYDPEAEDA
jgi:hypothetical protein